MSNRNDENLFVGAGGLPASSDYDDTGNSYSDRSLLMDLSSPLTSIVTDGNLPHKQLSTQDNVFANAHPSIKVDKRNLRDECDLFIKAEDGGGDRNKDLKILNIDIDEKSSDSEQSISESQNDKPSIDSTQKSPPINTSVTTTTTKVDDNTESGTELPLDESIPNTVTELVAFDGGKVYIVGTTHFSVQSQEDVARVIRQVSPHVVMVELCVQRTNILQLNEEVILREAKNINLKKIRMTVAENGLFNGLMYILLLNMSAHITKELGMAPGGEFRRALAEAKQIPNCIVMLGDRPIDVTLQRALALLSWGQTIRFIWHLLTYKDPITAEEVERCKQQKMLDEMMEEMAEVFPTLKQVFVSERDLYLAHSLLQATHQAKKEIGAHEPVRVVGVVGIGHMKGIVENWGNISSRDIPPLMRIPPTSLSTRIIRVSFKAAFVGLVIYTGYKLVPRRWYL